jgi:hypothetical protein
MNRTLEREAGQTGRQLDEPFFILKGGITQFRQFLEGLVQIPTPERPGETGRKTLDFVQWIAECSSHQAHCTARSQLVDSAHHSSAPGEKTKKVVDDLISSLRVKVHVYVGHVSSALIHKALKEKVVGHRIHSPQKEIHHQTARG